MKSLNPCCNGIYSVRELKDDASVLPHDVLILVVMEYTL